MSIEVVNETDVAIDVDALEAQARFTLGRLRIHPQADLSVVLIDEAAMTDLHVKWMDEPGPTDVMSFPMDELRPTKDDEEPEEGLLGDVVICPQVAAKQAETAGHRLEQLERDRGRARLQLVGQSDSGQSGPDDQHVDIDHNALLC